MHKKMVSSFVKSGKVFSPDLPAQLDVSQPPLVLAEVSVKPSLVNRPAVILQYSEFFNFTMFGLNPKFVILYRLIRDERNENYPQILQEWEFELETPDLLEVGNLVTSQPTVLNFCDCLAGEVDETLTYKLEIVQIQTHNVTSFAITNKSFTATLLPQAPKTL